MSVIYPNPVWPVDAEILALNGTTDPATGLAYVDRLVGPSTVPSVEVQLNRTRQRAREILALVNGGRVVDEGGLDIGVYAVAFCADGDIAVFNGATGETLADDATTCVWLDLTPELQTGAAFPADLSAHFPLATVVTAGGAIASITDARGPVVFSLPLLGSRPSYAVAGENDDITELKGLAVDLALTHGGTGASDAAGARANLSAAESGANSSITSLSGLTTPLSVAQGGTAAATAGGARTALGAAESGANSSITSLSGLTTPLSVAQGGTGQTTANVVPFAPSMVLAGTLAVKVYEIEWVAPVDFTLQNAIGRVVTAPTGDTLIVDVRVNGTSIFATQAEMIAIVAGAFGDTSATKNHAVTAGDVITIEVEQIGSGVAGADLTVVLNGRCALQA
jgi:hypothetical protein